ncbi:MAG TPA: GH116 family glycosyl-hydrolase [Candidatus Sulfotelmatobacter sp.]|nr:GH116 family glycosyl-hydrolase [Candidatus Sulfotelmatobacter sp.]
MSKPKDINRRQFLGTTSAAALGFTALRNAPAGQGQQAFRSPAGSVIPFSRQDLLEPHTQRVFSGQELSEIAFPLGGIGTGTVSLGGRGQLRDWEIFNRPGKGKILPFSFVALWARSEGGAATVKVVESQIEPPYRGGGGFNRNSAEGLPRFRSAEFSGAYPFARIAFEDASLPVSVRLEAFNPFIPLNVDDSSLPVGIFHYHLRSFADKPVDVALAFTLLNAVGYDGKANLDGTRHAGFGKNIINLRQEQSGDAKITGLEFTSAKYGADDIQHGSMALLTTTPQASAKTAWAGGDWWDPFQKWYDEFAANGEMHDTEPDEPTADGRSNYGTLAPRTRLLPGESKTISFVFAWYFPNRENYWNEEKEVKGQKLRNYYGTKFGSAWEAGLHTIANLAQLEQQSRDFEKAFYSSSLPGHVLEAASSQAAILRTNTCMLLEGKQFFAFEGCDDNDGCCPMNCTHVWNYEQALAYLFPELERSMRHTDFTYNMRDDGSMAFRTLVPVGRAQWNFRPAADGQMGCIIKLYREWQISGDNDFLKQHWAAAKRALEFSWTHWDADKDGLFEGQQHNTYDIEFYGPNPMMATLYLGALRAGELMAQAVGDSASADSYRSIREKGIGNLEQLWNGEYYIQKIPPADKIQPMKKYADADWYKETVQDGQIHYQFGDGCLSDQLLGAWFADVIGLDTGLPSDRTKKALQSIYRYNFKNSFYDHPNTQRIYALNDEKGLLLCSWPKGGRPKLPFVYSDEVWTGIEFQVAAHLICHGLVDEGLSIVKGITDRYDGLRRNPWNEVECGSHYARALASWSVLMALSGYKYSAVEEQLRFAPVLGADNFQVFYSAGTAWGVYSQKIEGAAQQVRLEVVHGKLSLRSLHVKSTGGEKVSLSNLRGPQGESLTGAKLAMNGTTAQLDFGQSVRVPSGTALSFALRKG